MRKVGLLMATLSAVLLSVSAYADNGQFNGEVHSLGHAKIPFLVPQAGTCVEVDVELLQGANSDKTYTLSTEILNCGDAAAFITVDVTLDLNGTSLGPFTHHVQIAAGASLVRSISFGTQIPIPTGDYSLCVTATTGPSSDQDCATLSVSASPTARPIVESSPNPFNAQTRISYQVTQAGRVRLEIFNLLGRSVTTLVDAEASPGVYSAIWDGRDRNGAEVSSGVYFYRLLSGTESVTRQMTLLK